MRTWTVKYPCPDCDGPTGPGQQIYRTHAAEACPNEGCGGGWNTRTFKSLAEFKRFASALEDKSTPR
jgi:hypothetical protein